MNILFVDPVCPSEYSLNTLITKPLGGTEASCVRIAEALRARGNTVAVSQHCRKEPETSSGGVLYSPFGTKRDILPTHVIVLRDPMALYQAKKQFPNAKLYLWLHDIVGGGNWDKGGQSIIDNQAVPILVSDWHKTNFYQHLTSIGFSGVIPSRRIYNPIEEDLKPDASVVKDSNKLVFFSSPHKGLDNTLRVFERFVDFAELKDIILYVANPGYFESKDTNGLRNVKNLGQLPHKDVIDHVRSAFAVFHLNPNYPETFGLVHAESNAVGTPFLTSYLGAAPETTDHPAELIDVSDAKLVIDRMVQWKKYGAPKVRGNPFFRLSKVIREWEDLLCR